MELSFNRIKFHLILSVITGPIWKQFESDWGNLELGVSVSILGIVLVLESITGFPWWRSG